MKLLPTCREVQTLATEYQEGTLSFTQRLGIRLHLLLCWACRAFIQSLKALPSLSRKILKPEPAGPPQEAVNALDDAIARGFKDMQEGRTVDQKEAERRLSRWG